MRLVDKYRKEIRELDWTPTEEFVSDDCYDDTPECVSSYLGNWMTISPSGKIYTPWARGNVDLCPTCSGAGVYPRKREECTSCEGSGWRYIAELAKLRGESEEDTRAFLLLQYPEAKITDKLFTCNLCQGEREVRVTCHACQGLGSNEAYRDSVFQDILQEVAGEKGGWIETVDEHLYFVKIVEDEGND